MRSAHETSTIFWPVECDHIMLRRRQVEFGNPVDVSVVASILSAKEVPLIARFRPLLVAIPVAFLLCSACLALAGKPQVLKTDEQLFGSPVAYLTQPASNGVLVLDANNGFFDNGAFRADGQKPVPEDEKALISSHFSYLTAKNTNDGEARWYILIPAAGKVEIAIYMDVLRPSVGEGWTVAIDQQSKRLRLAEGSKTSAQPTELRFVIDSPGKHSVSLRRDDTRKPSNVKIYGLVLRGEAVAKASLLRARWRPAAVHTQYQSSTCPTTRMWVFESQNISDVGSYSPLTTRFGYFGGSFSGDRTASGGVNFSMWAAGQNAKAAPPVDQMPHLLATGNPDAEFGGFGHEGSGVKIRNWEPYSHHPLSIIQALRVENDAGYSTYSGYLFDERADRWVLYAVGRKKNDARKAEAGRTMLRPASFCEVPGPPNVQRTGDQRRAIRRRGWFLDGDNCWHPVDRQTVAIKPKDAPVNKFIGTDSEGWLVMGTGGMEMLDGQRDIRVRIPSRDLPRYLQPDKAKQLFELPIGIGQAHASQVTAKSASISYQLTDLGPTAKAILYYGPQDCVTFVSRELHGTEKRGLSSELLSADRTWSESTKPQRVSNGVNRFELSNLKPNVPYFYRLLVLDDDGKCWAMQSGQFTTR